MIEWLPYMIPEGCSTPDHLQPDRRRDPAGLGFALTEQRIVDERFGAVVNSNLEDYKVFTQPDVPDMIPEMVDLPDPLANNLGVKGVGEPPIIPTAAAVANAVADALGVRIKDLPITRQKILGALRGNNCRLRPETPRV